MKFSELLEFLNALNIKGDPEIFFTTPDFKQFDLLRAISCGVVNQKAFERGNLMQAEDVLIHDIVTFQLIARD
jgi:hypothetical protein